MALTDNMRHWNRISKPPVTSLKPIAAGRLKGKTDINPQWRMQAITEVFGPCGIGWKYTIDKLWSEPGDGVQITSFALISLYYKEGEAWSDPIPGIGGSMLVEQESRGPHTSDEAYKMAVTDALSVAMKAIGMAAEIYMGNYDGSKYTGQAAQALKPAAQPENTDPKDAEHHDRIKAALHALYGDDKTGALDKVEELTSFIPKGKAEAERVKGVRNFLMLKGDRAKYLAHGLEKLVQKEPAMCNECRQTGGHSESCPNNHP